MNRAHIDDYELIYCTFCYGTGYRVDKIFRKRQPGTVERPREQEYNRHWQGPHDLEHVCPICLGADHIAVEKETDILIWLPCAPCDSYGRILTDDDKTPTSSSLCTVSPTPCKSCGGLGFTIKHIENETIRLRKAFPNTGETTRLS
jgi:hypothetical protein